jgi:hypothetical protein
MGQIQGHICVHLARLESWEQLQAEDFTVQRNSHGSLELGCKEESGWRIQQRLHTTCCSGHDSKTGPTNSAELGEAVATKYAKGDSDVWRVYMNNGWDQGFDKHACGWRVCDPSRRTFWPTRCKTPMEKEAWWKWFDTQLARLSGEGSNHRKN